MVISCCRTAFYETQQKHAHPSFVTLKIFDNARFTVWRGALKIRVSMVRFRPRPPNKETPIRASRWGFFFWGLGWISKVRNAR